MADEPNAVPEAPAGVSALFMAMDETESVQTGVLSLVGLLCPLQQVKALRDATYRFLDELQELPPHHINMSPPELHGSAMLKEVGWATDEKRLRCFQHVVQMVNEHRLKVLRCAYYRESVKNFLKDAVNRA